MAILLNLSPSPHPSIPPSKPSSPKPNSLSPTHRPLSIGKRQLLLKTTILGSVCLTAQNTLALAFAEPSPPPRPLLSGISNTRNWFQFYGDGFSIRVPPEFEDVSEPEDFNAGLSLYGDKAKTKEFAARFASHDGSEVLHVLIRPTNQLKITFLEAQDVADLGSLKEVAKIFVPGGSTLYAARTIKIKDEEDLRTYYFYEFGRDDQHVALVAAVKSGKAIIAGATAPRSKWDDDSVKLRSAAISMTIL